MPLSKRPISASAAHLFDGMNGPSADILVRSDAQISNRIVSPPRAQTREAFGAVSLLPLLAVTFRIRKRRQAGRTLYASRIRRTEPVRIELLDIAADKNVRAPRRVGNAKHSQNCNSFLVLRPCLQTYLWVYLPVFVVRSVAAFCITCVSWYESSNPARFLYHEHIQTSTNLQNWSSTAGLLATNSSFQFVDPTATNFPQRFYQVTLP
jgi:hypothetical protein